MKVLVRCDASTTLGRGHLARCLVLARALIAKGARVTFLCQPLPGFDPQQIETAGAHWLPWSGDHAPAWAHWRERLGARADWLIVDHYDLAHHWEQGARALARHLMVVDDLADRPHACDLLLDQNLTASAERYAARLPAGGQCLLGPAYALLGPEYAQPPAPAQPLERILVSVGGFDPRGVTLKVARALASIPAVQATLVAGAGNPDHPALEALVGERPGWRLYGFTSEMPLLLRQAGLCIGAGGSSSWERAAIGVPTLCLSVAANQRENAACLAAAGAHRYLGDAEQVSEASLRGAVTALLADPIATSAMAARGRTLVDGQGTARVVNALAAITTSPKEHS
ncbi:MULTISPECIES: UDP-2,4-diacetamido-2,4,6-trideoxy-beta-L-altropyranose hydrolase [unclassified Pseudomonas]|uniref:UDP-2,4-diacetamido-2,4, 6-trideoxy-beta-L-altropyranose hydrolase n=1 Tax=unclassified Pseudomonas TaxID=196821 RepID=UPI000BDB66E1|nr:MULTISPECIES: UDP-2,4-diacetamido-2,4,6-trideoxy-beta-L-altropyranose hydrolase [unclassified Pseudomonas]PVZ13726.1 UDP-2,4-diacetamido-2,4,6-trideoxy-beta-L-altropyranose hydrolase [Pseudomonas sp. URIL14HWK12:I12]PVZ24032.1 UDP-2,4-diacetamido-2,4,6-trideoxy-beta-L-altropyranose hydrolase [Pseudomonas sp. URIL14HWK12:I10]PVZ33329.1 UDP-2,4-diacetamido-2,4,6-trideoxy-beta-L-altropyranose hydrolase [Pseudomonas sp. URIL14HWK12:I11]SNZ11166.1 UDP-2,4-diacetamido-2,4,6-trideoxy-beta-L-altropy